MYLVFYYFLTTAVIQIVLPRGSDVLGLEVWPVKNAMVQVVWFVVNVPPRENGEEHQEYDSINSFNNNNTLTELQLPNLFNKLLC